MRDLAALEIRRLHRKIAQVDRRVALATLPGKVHPGSQDMEKRTVRLEIGQTSEGQPVLSPPVRWQQPGAGNLKVHAVPKDGEQMTLHSPSGTVGSGSLAVWATYDKDNEPPSKDPEAHVIDYQGTRITLKKEQVLIERGDATVLLNDSMVRGKFKDSRFVAADAGAKIRKGNSWVVVDGGRVIVSSPPQVGGDPVNEST